MDITEVILNQHHELRRAFAVLDELDRHDGERLAAVWSRLAIRLEVHALAEEQFFYPRLLEVGHGAGGDSAASETEDAIKDHNEIRDAVAAAARHPAGNKAWWRSVLDARAANSDHLAEEEREDLADFRRHADLATRHAVAVDFITFQCRHADGVAAHNRDPHDYVAQHS